MEEVVYYNSIFAWGRYSSEVLFNLSIIENHSKSFSDWCIVSCELFTQRKKREINKTERHNVPKVVGLNVVSLEEMLHFKMVILRNVISLKLFG